MPWYKRRPHPKRGLRVDAEFCFHGVHADQSLRFARVCLARRGRASWTQEKLVTSGTARRAKTHAKRTDDVNPIKRVCYKSCLLAIRGYQRLFMRYRVVGRELIPTGPKLFVSNHISAFDAIWVLPVFPEPIHFIVGAPFAVRGMGWLCRQFDQINALAPHRGTVVEEAVKRLSAGASVFICPEGDLHEQFTLGRFYPGAARMYRQTRVPIVPMAFVAPKASLREYPFPTRVDGRVYRCVVGLRGPFVINIGEPMKPAIPKSGSEKEIDEEITRQMKERIAQLVEEVRCEEGWKD